MTLHVRTASWLLLTAVLGCSGGSSTGKPPGMTGAHYTKIDDMEEGTNVIAWPSRPGLAPPGFWFSMTDCSQADRISPGPVTPELNPWSYSEVEMPYETFPPTTSHHAARLFTTSALVGVWGAQMGVALAGNPEPAGAAPDPGNGGEGGTGGAPAGSAPATGRPCKQGSALDYPDTVASDISAYSGITFWAKVAPESEAKTIRVQLNDSNTDPRGRFCNRDDPTSDTNCYNAFGTSVTLTDKFIRYTVDFASLVQRPNWGFHPPSGTVDTQHVYNLDFEVDLPDCASTPDTMCAGGPPSVAFDFSIDDLYFVNK